MWDNLRMSMLREELHRVIDRLPEDQLRSTLTAVQQRIPGSCTESKNQWPPDWFGSYRSGRTDTSERVDELLAR